MVRTDDRGTVLVGTGGWALALGVCALLRDQLVAAGNGWWLGVCAAGVGLGFVALAHLQRLEVRHRRRGAADRS